MTNPQNNFAPYAAKAIIEHGFDIDHLDIWITFRLPMKICSDPLDNPTVFDIKPANENWLVKIDTVETPITSSAWLDEYTMHLTIDEVVTQPTDLTVSYIAPSPLLITIWSKQWEPWVDIVSTDKYSKLWSTGMIILWSGSIVTIPTGWNLCDGTNGTPNLLDKFIVAAGNTYEVDATGGAVNHTHAATQAGHSHYQSGGNGIASGSGWSNAHTTVTPAITVPNATNLPPYYALAYIMKL